MKTIARTVAVGVFGCMVGAIVTVQIVRGQSSNPLEGGLSHISFAVSDVDDASQAFAGVLGVEANPSAEYRDIPYGPRFPDKVMQAKVSSFMFNGVMFEFIEGLEGDSPWKDFVEANGDGVHHIGFSVPNVTEAREYLESKGGTWTQDYMGFAAYIDMNPILPITFEVTPAAPPANR